MSPGNATTVPQGLVYTGWNMETGYSLLRRKISSTSKKEIGNRVQTTQTNRQRMKNDANNTHRKTTSIPMSSADVRTNTTKEDGSP